MKIAITLKNIELLHSYILSNVCIKQFELYFIRNLINLDTFIFNSFTF